MARKVNDISVVRWLHNRLTAIRRGYTAAVHFEIASVIDAELTVSDRDHMQDRIEARIRLFNLEMSAWSPTSSA